MNQMDTNQPNLGHELGLFIRHIDSLQQTLPITIFMMQELAKKSHEKLLAFEDKYCEVETSEEKRTISIPPEHYNEWKKLNKQFDKANLSNKLLPRSIFVTLVSQYDAFLGILIRTIFINKQDLLKSCEKQLTYSSINAFKSIEDLKLYLIEKEVESVLRESHEEQFKWMEKRFSVELRKGLPAWQPFIELTERRNLFVHTDGIVSSQYILNCKSNSVPLEDTIKVGDQLNISPSYFRASCRNLLEIGIKLTHVLWRKQFPDDTENADDHINDICLDFISSKDYQIACNILDFICENFKKPSNEWHQLVFIVNRAQAYKWSGDNNKCVKILSEIDWSAKGDEFKLCSNVLLEKWDESLKIMKKIGASGTVQKDAYRSWPVFNKFPEHPDFAPTFQEIFNEPFNRTTVSDQRIDDDLIDGKQTDAH